MNKMLDRISPPPERVTIHTKRSGVKDYDAILKEFVNRERIAKLKIKNTMPDSLKYNPNFNAIYKKTPAVKISHPQETSFSEAKDRAKMKEEEKIEKIKSHLSQKDIRGMTLSTPRLTTLNNINTMNVDNCKSITTENSPKSKIKGILYFKNYSPRKVTELKNNNENDVLCYTKPDLPTLKYNHSYDFNKMTKRKEVKVKDCVPPIGSYVPKYNIIHKNETLAVPYDTKPNKFDKKRFLIKKLWGSYDLSSEYQITKLK